MGEFEDILSLEMESKQRIQRAQEEAEKVKQEGIKEAERILASLKGELKRYEEEGIKGIKEELEVKRKELEEEYKKKIEKFKERFETLKEKLKGKIPQMFGLE